MAYTLKVMLFKPTTVRSTLILFHQEVQKSLNNNGSFRGFVTKSPNSSADTEKPKDQSRTGSSATQTQSNTSKQNTTSTTQNQHFTATTTTSSGTSNPKNQSPSDKATSSTIPNHQRINGPTTESQVSTTTSVPMTTLTEKTNSLNVNTSCNSQTTSQNQSRNLPPTPEEESIQESKSKTNSEMPKSSRIQSSTPQNKPTPVKTGVSTSQGDHVVATTMLPISHGMSTVTTTQLPTPENKHHSLTNRSLKSPPQATGDTKVNMNQSPPSLISSNKTPTQQELHSDGYSEVYNTSASSKPTGHTMLSSIIPSNNMSPKLKVPPTHSDTETNLKVSSTTSTPQIKSTVLKESSKPLPVPKVQMQSQAPQAQHIIPIEPCVQSTSASQPPKLQVNPEVEPIAPITTALKTSQVQPLTVNTQISPQFKLGPPTATILSGTQHNQQAAMQKESQSFLMNLFLGVVKPDQVFPFPSVLTANQRETTQLMVNSVEKLFKKLNDAEENAKCLDALREMGLFGLQVPQELGGLGLNNTQYAKLVEVIGGNDLALAITLGSQQSIGLKGIQMVGTAEQKAKYLPHLSKGIQFAALCLTEPSAACDIKSIQTKAVLSPDGKHYILNGSNLWVNNGGVCDIITVFAKITGNEREGKEADGLTAFIVEQTFRGVSGGHLQEMMGTQTSNTTQIFFNDVQVPVENVLGEVGGGYKLAMNILNSRRFSLGAALSGTMREVMKKTIDFAKTRIQLEKQITSYGTIQEKIARMAMLHYVTETLTYLVAGNMDDSATNLKMEAAICKVFASEATWMITDEAIQILGGMGCMHETGLERILRDVRVFRIFEGPNEVLHHFIALHGLRYTEIHIKDLRKAFRQPRKNIHFIINQVRPHILSALGLNKTTSMLMKNHTHTALAQAAQDTGKSIDRFGYTIALIALKYGKGIAKEQFILNRIAKAAIDIYGSIATLSRTTDSLNRKLPSAKHELLMTQVWCEEANRRVITNMKDLSMIPNQKLHFHKMGDIAKNVCEANGVVQQNQV